MKTIFDEYDTTGAQTRPFLHRFTHKIKKEHIPIELVSPQEGSGPKNWEQQMVALSNRHKKVKWMKYNFTVGNYNQKAYNKINLIRSHISEIPPEIITLIPSARWLLDNFQMLYREIKKVKTVGTSYMKLPVLQSTEFRGYPRIYVLAKKMVDISGGYLNENNICLMIKAYQNELPLMEIELHALTKMIGLCLSERTIEVAEEITQKIMNKSKAERFVKERLVETQGYVDIAPLLIKMNEDCYKDISFHSHVIYLLSNMPVEEKAIQRYISYHCKQRGMSVTALEIFTDEGKIESLLESNIRAPIISLREISQINEETLFEELSLLEHILSKDPDGVYPAMDSASRGMYRAVIAKLSYKLNIHEGDIGEACIDLANEGPKDLKCPHHVGTYLVGKGYPLLKSKVIKKSKLPKLSQDHNIKGFSYFMLIGLFLLISYTLLFFVTERLGAIGSIRNYAILLLISLPIMSGIATKITNNILTRLVPAQRIPALDYLEKIPDSARTFVVMPVIISTKEQALGYLEGLHTQYLANTQSNLFFALLVDYSDSLEEHDPEDDVIKYALIDRIDELNKQYASNHKRFSLFIRSRMWNQAENCYMGWERKRGKLEEFNSLLNGVEERNTSFSTLLCDKELLGTFKYVITLDADSGLQRDNAAKLVGIIDHPLNRAVVDPVKRKVKEGYAIIQPSVRNHIVNRRSSLFPKIFGSQIGLANYSMVTSDIYQDIFKEGVFIGKGIYNVHVFHQILHKTIPDNRVLSHDLLESCYVRTAFVSTVHILENFPGSVISYKKREHRWIRGDWQLLPWLFNKNLSVLSKWKIFDNLRASLVPLSKMFLIFFNLILVPDIYYLWIPVLFFPTIFDVTVLLSGIVLHKIRRPKLAVVHSSLRHEVVLIFQRAFLEIVFIPSNAYTASDAIVRVLFRLAVSKKHMLMWKSADVAEKSIISTKKYYFLYMWHSLIPAVAILGLLIIANMPLLAIALYSALALVWGFSFLIAYKISQSRDKTLNNNTTHKNEDVILSDIARRTWRFFNAYSTSDNNWLCPDNYKISDSNKKTTNKSSPTNIGLQFLSILSARDFGFETLSLTVEKIENLLYTVAVLPKWKGHLFNWYNINTLEVLNPQYISTVDSGNFCGDLIALKNGLLEQINTPILPACMVSELRALVLQSNLNIEFRDTYETIGDFLTAIIRTRETIRNIDTSFRGEHRTSGELEKILNSIERDILEFGLGEYTFHDNVTLLQSAQSGNGYAKHFIDRLSGLSKTIDILLDAVDFKPLYNEHRMLFHIGYSVTSQMLDPGCYDLMASESSLASFFAISRGEVPAKHWSKLGRPLILVKGIPAHVSWSGTMFEYLMPNLLMKNYDGTVFSDSSKAAVLQQIKYAKQMGIPWGISESQYFRFDNDSNYQYHAFGVPELRLQISYSDLLVVSPYSTMLALEYKSDEALSNLKRMKELGAYGEFGYYEAIDFSVPDPMALTPYRIVKSYMTHHMGMSLVAINNYVHNGIMRGRFHAEPIVKATESLLEEKRQTHFISVSKKGYTVNIKKNNISEDDILRMRYIKAVAPPIPTVNHLSNGNYSLMITSDGDGFSDCTGMMLYRWRPDVYANTGSYIYIKDIEKDKFWSVAYNPTKAEPEEYQVIFSHYQAEFKRRDGDIATNTIVSLSPDHNLEIRKVTLKNYGKNEKQIEITSYLEVVADSYLADLSHPAFRKLFIESEFVEETSTFLSRRRSSEENRNPYIFHTVKSDNKLLTSVKHENDRLKFIGRNKTLQNPDAVVKSMPFSNSTGFSNDPIMSISACICLEAEQTISITFITGVCEDKEDAVRISDELSISYRVDDIIEKFRQQSLMEIKYLNITGKQFNAFQNIISPLYYSSRYHRGPTENISRNWKNQSFLWRFGVSGDNPVMLLRVSSLHELWIIEGVLKAYEYLRINQVKVDLIILNEAKHGYMQELTSFLNNRTSALRVYGEERDRPSLFILHSYQMVPAEVDLLFTVARVVFSKETGIYFRDFNTD